jgi:DNA-binding transcriptional LysR family regulator
MELYQLRSFAAIAELGQLTRAAEKVHISQPALSSQLKALEDEIGLPLFERTPNGMVLTAAGKQLLAAAEKVLAASQKLQNLARSLKGEVAGKVSVGTLSDPEFIRLAEFMGATMERFPLLEVELRQEVTGEALEEVRDGALDASFYYGDIAHPAVAGLRLREITYRVAAPAEWCERLAGAGWEEIAEQPWIIPPSISTHHKLAYSVLRDHGVEPSRVVEADQEAVVSSLVVAGLGIALMREDMALEKAAAGEICLWNEVRVTTTLWFIYLRERQDDPEIRALIGVQRDVWQINDDNDFESAQKTPPRQRKSA